MEALIFDVKRFAVHDGPGLRTTIFFKGCPLSCLWCHNPESQSFNIEVCKVERKVGDRTTSYDKEMGYFSSVESLMNIFRKDSLYFEESGGGVTFSGGEPMMQIDFLLAVLKKCKEADIHTAVDTSGFASWDNFQKIMPYTDLFLFDIKHIDSEKHRLLTGVDNSVILDNLSKITNLGKKVWIRIPAIPTCNNDDNSISNIIHFIAQLKSDAISQINILPFHKLANHKYSNLGLQNCLTDINEPTNDEIQILKQKFEILRIPILTKG